MALFFPLALTACLVSAVWGIVLMRDRGPTERLGLEPDRAEGAARQSLVDKLAARLGPKALTLLSPERQASVRRKIERAGRPGGMTVEGYAGRKAAHLAVAAVIGFLVALWGIPLLSLPLLLGAFLYVDVRLGGLARRRQQQIDRALPDFLDILAVTVSAGIGFLPALQRVTGITKGALHEELETTMSQMDLGQSRRQAFRALRERNGSESLARFVTALLQAEELGVPLTDTLAELARDMRRFFQQDARRRAAKAAPRVALVVTMVILPGALILVIAAFVLGSDVSFPSAGG